MFNIWNSNVFVEIGEAVGNVASRALGRRGGHPDLVEKLFRRHLQESQVLDLPLLAQSREKPSEEVIEGSFRALAEEESP